MGAQRMSPRGASRDQVSATSSGARVAHATLRGRWASSETSIPVLSRPSDPVLVRSETAKLSYADAAFTREQR